MGVYRSSKRYGVYFFSTAVALFGTLLLYGFIFDPWQLFHQPWFRKPVFISNARFQNAGIINSYSFDSAILGNSMAENFSAEEASRLLGGKFVNLSMAGSLFSERQIVLEHLFRQKDIKQIIISADHQPKISVGQYNTDLPPERYSFLYNSNPLDDFRIYFDVQLFRCRDLAKDCTKELPGVRRTSLNELYSWFPYYVKAFGGTQAWCSWSRRSAPFKTFLQEIINVSRAVDNKNQLPWNEDLIEECRNNARSTFTEYILPVAEKNPDTEFLLFFPPYSRLWYSMQEQYYIGYYQAYLLFIKDVVRAVSSHSNVRLFGFDDMDFTGDIANYKDQSHYHKDINSKLLELMAEQKGLLTEDNLVDYTERIRDAAHNYDLTAVAQEFETCLNRQ